VNKHKKVLIYLLNHRNLLEQLKYRNISVAVDHAYQKILLIFFFSRPQREESLVSHKNNSFFKPHVVTKREIAGGTNR